MPRLKQPVDVAQQSQDAAGKARAAELAQIEKATIEKGVAAKKLAKEAEDAAKKAAVEATAKAKEAAKVAAAAMKEAEALKAKAKRDEEKLKKQKAAEKARELKKAAAEGAKKAKHTQAYKELTPIGREINVRFEKAAKLESDADDHRLAASLKLADAEKICETNSIPFKTWAAENVTQGWETVRKLVVIGRAGPDEAPKLLEDMRNKNSEANKAARERKKAERVAATAAGTAPVGVGTKPAAVSEALTTLKPEAALAVVTAHAKDLGMAVVSDTDAKALEQFKKLPADKKGGLAGAKAVFDALKPADRLKLAEYAAEVLGFKLVMIDTPLTTETTDQLLDIPAGLKR